jgi:hypothetical protein
MATKLNKFDFSAPSAITTSEKAVYPWTEWLDGDIWQLTEGEDFDTHPLMMERIVRTRATARGAKVRLRHVPLNGSSPFGMIVMQRTDVAGPAALKKAEQTEKRASKKAAAQAEAQEIVRNLKVVPNGKPKPSKKAAAKPTTAKKSISKRPSRPAPKVAAKA